MIEAFLPNPCRLHELLIPGATLYLNGDSTSGAGPERKTEHTVLAVERDGSPIYLHTHRANAVARALIETGRIPELAGARVVRPEVVAGRSRFDFLLERTGRLVYLEVKSCTLFGNGVAMFPDAVTERGRRHLLELASHTRGDARPLVLFLVHTPRVQWFMPDYHTDLEFSQTLLKVRNRIDILPLAIEWKSDLSIGSTIRTLPVPWDWLESEMRDRGSYLLILRLSRDRRICVGRLGDLRFRRGFYVYAGSAMQNLSGRLAWHHRRRKHLHWHIDYLRQAADDVVSLPIRSSQREECTIAQALFGPLNAGAQGFGCSDCRCPTHLFHSPTNPLFSANFHAVLQKFRMKSPC